VRGLTGLSLKTSITVNKCGVKKSPQNWFLTNNLLVGFPSLDSLADNSEVDQLLAWFNNVVRLAPISKGQPGNL
jgi:hypothetical protein